MRTWAVGTVIVLLLAVPAQVYGADRKGFIIGSDLGGAHVSHHAYGNRYSKPALTYELRVGGGISEQWLVYAFSHVVAFRSADRDMSHTIMGIGGTYFVRPQAPSLFLEGGTGMSAWPGGGGWVGEGGSAQYGVGAWLGAGFEFHRHFTIRLDTGIGSGDNNRTSSIGVCIGYLRY